MNRVEQCDFPWCGEPAVGYWLPPGHYLDQAPAADLVVARRRQGEFVHALPKIHRCQGHAPADVAWRPAGPESVGSLVGTLVEVPSWHRLDDVTVPAVVGHG